MKKTLILWITVVMAFVECVASEYVMPDTVMLQEVTVSAVKSGVAADDESSATVVNQKEIELHRVMTVKSVSNLIPNFYIPDYGSRITSSIYVRGIGARMDQPAVGLNVDNVPILNKDAYDFDVVDIAKVEMLRGPQSTLYGRNTMGGQINISTLSPLKWQGMRLMAEYGSGNSWKGSASWYHKFGDNIGLSLSAYYATSDGFFENEYNEKKCDWEDIWTGRVKFEWRVSDKVMLQNNFSLSNSRQGGYPYKYIPTQQIAYNDTCFYKRLNFSDGLTLRWFADKFSVTSMSSLQYINDNMTLDQDFLPLEYFTLTQAKKEWALTEDVVVKSEWDKSYNWLIGVFGFYKDLDMDAPVTFKDYGISQLIEAHRNDANPHYPIEWFTREFPLNSEFVNRTWGLAAYHQSSLDLDRFHLKLGLRLDYEKSSLSYHSHCNTGYDVYRCDVSTGAKEFYKSTTVDIDERGELSKSFTELLPKIVASYDLVDTRLWNIYVSASKGYKSGGFNTQMFSDVLQQKLMGVMGIGASYDVDDIVSYLPEVSWNYEVGSRFSTDDATFNLDLSLFYIDCRNQQLTVFPDGTTTGRIMTNAGKTRSFGAEMTLKYAMTKNLNWSLSYGYTNAKFREFDNGKSDYSGKYLPYVPQHTFYAGLDYTLDVKQSWLNSIIFDLNLRGVGKIYWDEANEYKQNFYATLGASVTFELEKFSILLWGDNITDTQYNTFYFVSIGNGFLQQGKPATFGATLRVNI